MKGLRPLLVDRSPDEAENEHELVGYGCQFPSGTIVVEWEPEAFPEGERTNQPTQSIYGDLADARQATGGEIVFVGGED